MEGNKSTFKPEDHDSNDALMYSSEKYFLKDIYSDEDELLSYIYSIIEANTIKSCIDDSSSEYIEYLKFKNREIRWLSAKSRFRAKSNLSR
ncbi:MAG: hypothetical protein HZC47_03305 [Methanobacterium sp.]|uniref:hypothetical protein n=1 Tax=Methanobacterium sp. TaxID=2164 RepID=UPI003D65F4C4|nr:hypothetical protein [Methanobacterium sp.]